MAPRARTFVANTQMICSIIGATAVLGGVIFAAGDRSGAISNYRDQIEQGKKEVETVKADVKAIQSHITQLEISEAKTQRDLSYIVDWVKEQKQKGN